MSKRLWASGHIQGNASQTWFQSNPPDNIATFHAIPIAQHIWGTDDPPRYDPDYDQIVKISDVFMIVKGNIHWRDGSGGQGDHQVNVTITNLTSFVTEYQIWVWD